jgi:hypothetical protein
VDTHARTGQIKAHTNIAELLIDIQTKVSENTTSAETQIMNQLFGATQPIQRRDLISAKLRNSHCAKEKLNLREQFTSNGILSMLINGRENQRRVNSMRDSDSMLKETSTLSHNFQTTDTLILSTTGTWSSRHQMEEKPNSGTSINNL